MSSIKCLAASVLCLASLAGPPLRGEELSQTLAVSLELIAHCDLSADTYALDFGTQYNYGQPTQAAVDAQVNLAISCTQDEAWSLYADLGLHSASNQRYLASANSDGLIAYDLYTDSARTLPISTSADSPLTGTGSTTALVLYGRIPASTELGTSGLYNDTVVMTLSF